MLMLGCAPTYVAQTEKDGETDRDRGAVTVVVVVVVVVVLVVVVVVAAVVAVVAVVAVGVVVVVVVVVELWSDLYKETERQIDP
jgi:Flp pilus assembly protein TadB